jgi:glycosyltransferase involved in cell wall biosynthesis
MRIFVRVPSNVPSGGVKVANQLVNLFREKGLESFLVVNGDPNIASWMITPAPVISVGDLMKICKTNDIVIDNWIDRYTIETTKKLNAKIKIYYSQGSTFYKSKNLIGDEHLKTSKVHTHYWTVSADAQKILESKYPKTGKWHLVHPYLEHDVISFVREDTEQRENAILCLARKGKSYIFFTKLLLGCEIKFDVIDREFTEIEAYKLMAKYKFFLSTAVGVSPQLVRNMVKLLIGRRHVKVINPYREGFPLPPAEAAACGSICIGFAMGGGLEWMSPSTCFLAKDRSYFSLMTKIREALSASDEQLSTLRENAFKAVSKFNKQHTWKQVKSFLEETI